MKIFLILLIISTKIFSQNWAINQIGYDLDYQKRAILYNSSSSLSDNNFEIISEGNVIYSGVLSEMKQVDGWNNRYFWVADFSDLTEIGNFTIQLKDKSTISSTFKIDKNILYNDLYSSQISFFKGMRNTLSSHKNVTKYGDNSGKTYDVYGGWSDATGDYGKYLSHQSNANYINPQQTPMVIWSLLKSYDLMTQDQKSNSSSLQNEAVWGADFLLRMLDKDNYFYITIFDGWSWDPPFQITAWEGSGGTKTSNYKAAFREGAGMSIAALAKASYLGFQGDSTSTQYLNGAIRAYYHLRSNNLKYCDDGKENIIDDYTALMAITELYKATKDDIYITYGSERVKRILAKQNSKGWFYADDAKTRPFFHAAEEGLVSIALMEFSQIDDSLNNIIEDAVIKNANWYITISEKVTNPFQYARELIKPVGGNIKESFFFPHKNETGYWWQGENARLASISTMLFRVVNKYENSKNLKKDQIIDYAISQMDWILGLNPYGICMVYDKGHTNYPSYKEGKDGVMPNISGGICNGITSKDSDENDIDWMPYKQGSSDDWKNWRWIEQWLPHNAWFLLALSSFNANNHLTTDTKKITNNNKIDIYPNPFTNRIFTNSKIENSTIEIYNIQGILLLKDKLRQSTKIPTNFKSGLYKIIIKSENKKETFLRFKTKKIN